MYKNIMGKKKVTVTSKHGGFILHCLLPHQGARELFFLFLAIDDPVLELPAHIRHTLGTH
jgi:hypothetical protein